MTDIEKCQHCYFWRKGGELGSTSPYGRCCRYPQDLEKYANDWCGEYFNPLTENSKNGHGDKNP